MDAKQAAALRKPFPPETIGKLPRGGAMLDYVGHAAVCDRLLAVDPEWTWEPLATGEDGLPAMDAAGNLWIRLTICGVTRLGVGDGKNQKERIGDALRNAAMRFGVALDLWAKEDLHEFARATDPAPAPAPSPVPQETGELATRRQVTAIHAALSGRGITDRDHKLRGIATIIGRTVESTNDLTRSEAGAVLDSLATDQSDDPEPDGDGEPWGDT